MIGQPGRDNMHRDQLRGLPTLDLAQNNNGSLSKGKKTMTGSTSNETKLPRGFENDHQFQKYLASLSEYDRSRYHQLLNKNYQLKDELNKISQQTEEVIRREK